MFQKSIVLGIALLVCTSAVAADKLSGSVERGKTLYISCSGCHGADAMGKEPLQAPRLAGQRSWYLVTQLKNFRAGIRGTADGDSGGAMMRPMASMLQNDQAIADVAAYLESL